MKYNLSSHLLDSDYYFSRYYILNFVSMNRESIKKKIKKYFGTYSKFCKLAGIDRYHFQRDFLQASSVSAMDMADIEGLVASLRDQVVSPTKIWSKLKSLRRAIKASGGVPEFCRQNKDFKQGSVNGAIYGRNGYRGVAERLIKHFGL